MLKEFAQYLAEKNVAPKDRIFDLGNLQKLVVDSDGVPHVIERSSGVARRALGISTLTSLIQYIKSEFDSNASELLIQVNDPQSISVFGHLMPNGDRELLMDVRANLPELMINHFVSVESMVIGLQSQFVPTDDAKILLKVVGNVTDENVRKISDDGVSQSVTAKSGVASVSNVRVPNPVKLAPYRTFLGVAQPASKFVFRMRKGQDGPQGMLIPADGGAWRLEAIKNVADYLRTELADTGILILA